MAVGGTAHLAALASLSALEVAAWSELILAVKLYCCTLSTDYQVCLHFVIESLRFCSPIKK